MDSISYSAGLLIAKNLKSQGVEGLDLKKVMEAMEDVFEGNDFKIPIEEASQIFQQFAQEAQARQQEVAKKEGKMFLAENAKRPEVKVTESGLQYEVINSGDGRTPKATDKVTTHYTGTLINGTVFDSSVQRGTPATFPVNGVIQGWQEALQLMKEGDKWKLYIPFDLAYGARGAGSSIPPYATLIFEIELINIE